jgi:ribonuclease HI
VDSLATTEEKRDTAEFKVFTDGSSHDGGVGAAAIIYKKGQPRPVAQAKAHLGRSDKHNSYEAEVVGGILAMWLIANTQGTRRTVVSIYSDNQAFIKAAVKPSATPGQYLVREFAKEVNHSEARINLRWIPGHVGVRGNEAVDKLAKEAAAGRATRRVDLPPFLQRTLPRSSTVIKQVYHEKLQLRWALDWSESPRKTRFETVDDTFPFNSYRKRQQKLSRAHASVLMQVRSGHIPLNSYLHRIGKSESKKCTRCRVEQGGEAPTESVNHFIFNCNRYTLQRQELVRKVGAGDFTVKKMMLEMKFMKALAQYIGRTGRLRDD